MKVMNIFLLAKMCCLVVMISWGQGVRAQAEESMQTDTVTQSQTQQQRPRVFVMGQINSNVILPRMPQYLAMLESLKSLKEQYEAEAKKSENDFQRKFEEFMQGQKDFPKTILDKRQNELQIMLETNAEFRIKAQKLLAEAERSMLADVKAELAEAVAIVAQEKGVSIVYDLDDGSVPYIVQGLAADLTVAVMHHLGIDTTTSVPVQ
ncbi:MAG: OmpH family outer membrane protein [Bacteroides sp.]|nr:OmpH family outer membrane protein [Bacteroides sp.]MCM1516139.1 OmpH family outer membrane protein [Paraprevotella sp.]